LAWQVLAVGLAICPFEILPEWDSRFGLGQVVRVRGGRFGYLIVEPDPGVG
jgi:hypothetical protein